MKTLDEVIRAVHHCGLLTSFDDSYEYDGGCPYADCSACEEKRMLSKDIIKYLNEYKRISAKIEKIALGNITETLEKLDNPALTWDELRQMEGKAVWIDSVPLVRRWVIIKKFHPIGGNKNLFDMEVEDGGHFLRKNMRRDDPAWWQAYRKEKYEDAG